MVLDEDVAADVEGVLGMEVDKALYKNLVVQVSRLYLKEDFDLWFYNILSMIWYLT